MPEEIYQPGESDRVYMQQLNNVWLATNAVNTEAAVIKKSLDDWLYFPRERATRKPWIELTPEEQKAAHCDSCYHGYSCG